MNMASIGIVLLIISVICFDAGKASKAFVNMQCKTENVGQNGQKSLLECVITTTQDAAGAQIRVVTWKKDGDDEALLVYHRGNLTSRPGYAFAEPSWNNKNMNVSLLITNTEVRDKGGYTCMVMTDSGTDTKTTCLKVTAEYSTPIIYSKSETNAPNAEVTLVCNSEGGYPQGQLHWFDGHNTDWTKSAVMDAKETRSGLFDLSSKLTVLKGSNFSKYTCVVFNASGGKESEATFRFTDSQKISGDEQNEGLSTASKIVAPVVVIGSLITGLLMALLFYRRRNHKSRRHSAAPLMGNNQDVDPRYLNSLA